jgi:DNA-binding PadR family transcriptional regulator
MMHQKRGLRMLIMSMISSSPKNGVEIMNEIEIATRGWWRPSPGSVYPVLEQLASEGLIKKMEDGRYELTAKGDSEFNEWSPFAGRRRKRSLTLDDMLGEMASYISYLEEIKASDRQSKEIVERAAKIKELRDRLGKLTS